MSYVARDAHPLPWGGTLSPGLGGSSLGLAMNTRSVPLQLVQSGVQRRREESRVSRFQGFQLPALGRGEARVASETPLDRAASRDEGSRPIPPELAGHREYRAASERSVASRSPIGHQTPASIDVIPGRSAGTCPAHALTFTRHLAVSPGVTFREDGGRVWPVGLLGDRGNLECCMTRHHE
jgi:hypothetical protein